MPAVRTAGGGMAGTACGENDAGANGNMALPLGAAPVVKGRKRIEEFEI